MFCDIEDRIAGCRVLFGLNAWIGERAAVNDDQSSQKMAHLKALQSRHP